MAGRYTGRIDGVPSFKEGKVTRVHAWLDTLGLSWQDFSESFFYSDSMNDVPLLAEVSHPFAVNPSDALRTYAQTQGWPILSLFEATQDAKS